MPDKQLPPTKSGFPEAAIEIMYLDGGKGPPRLHLVITLDRLRQVLETYFEDQADAIVETIEDACEQGDPDAEEEGEEEAAAEEEAGT